jgi:hypothetical protein
MKGQVNVLEWFKKSGYKFKYNNYAIEYALKYNKLNIIKWFKNNGFKFKFKSNYIYNSNINIWFIEKKSRYKPIKYCKS